MLLCIGAGAIVAGPWTVPSSSGRKSASSPKYFLDCLIAVYRLHRRTGTGRHKSVCAVLLLQRQYAAATAEGFRRVLHPGVHFMKIVKDDVVHPGCTFEEFLQILVIRAVMSRQVVFLLPRVGVGDVAAVVCRHEIETAESPFHPAGTCLCATSSVRPSVFR